MSPFYEHIIRQIIDIQSQTGTPVKTGFLADALNKPGRSVRRYCRNLEASGVLIRPYGPKSGYSIKGYA